MERVNSRKTYGPLSGECNIVPQDACVDSPSGKWRFQKRWVHWLFEAKKRFGLRILNYTFTSNHIHLLVYDGKVNIIAKSIQLIAGRTAREYNQRKNRNGAFWQDRYHATAVKTGNHLIRCLAYIDLNMVRAGVVRHPCKWLFRKSQSLYNHVFAPEKCSLRLKNDHSWQISS
jgi:REP element-mobilizing transposase RayT